MIGVAILACCSTISPGALATTESDKIIQTYDANGDGRLDAGELARYLAKKTFQQFDTNNDKIISADEVNADANKRAGKITEDYPNGELDSKGVAYSLGLMEKTTSDPLGVIGQFLQLQNSYMTKSDKATDPAKLAWTLSKGKSTYNFDGALSYAGNGMLVAHWGSLNESISDIFWSPTVEAHVSSDTNANIDSVSFGIPVEYIRVRTAARTFITAHDISLTPYFETDSGFGAKTFNIRPMYSPTIPALAMGVGMGTNIGTVDVSFNWRPNIGFEVGRVLDDDNKPALVGKNTYTRFVLDVQAQIDISGRFVLNGKLAYRRFLDGDDHDYVYGEISPVFFLDQRQHFSLGVTLKSGKTTPTFKNVESVNLWVGLKF